MTWHTSPQCEIAITGRGVVSSIGEGADAFVDALLERRSGIVDGMAPCSEFDPETAMSAKVARRSDRYTQLAFAAADPGRRGGRACPATSTSSAWRSSSAPASAG